MCIRLYLCLSIYFYWFISSPLLLSISFKLSTPPPPPPSFVPLLSPPVYCFPIFPLSIPFFPHTLSLSSFSFPLQPTIPLPSSLIATFSHPLVVFSHLNCVSYSLLLFFTLTLIYFLLLNSSLSLRFTHSHYNFPCTQWLVFYSHNSCFSLT